MKYFVLVLLLILGVFFFQFRYLSPEAGINAKSTDYSTHISIEQHLKEGNLFPELEKPEKGLHAVSRYLPVYHGLLGFHFSAWFIEYLGVPLPGAYLLLMDASLAICLFVFGSILLQEFRKEKRWEHLFALFTLATIFISNFCLAVESAFFSQIMSYALVLLSLYLWQNKRVNCSIGVLLAAVITYPDFLVWFLPFLIFARNFRFHIIFRAVFATIWLVLILVLYSRRSLVGPEGVSLYPLFFLPLLLIFFGNFLRSNSREYFLLLFSYTVVVIGFLFVSHRNLNWSYYALKLTFPAVFFLLYAFIKLRMLQSARGRLFIALYIFFFWNFSELSLAAVENYVGRGRLLNNQYYASLLDTRKTVDHLEGGCEPRFTLVLPGASDFYSNTGMLKLWAKNSLMLNTDISTGAFKASSFQKLYNNLATFELNYSDAANGVLEGKNPLYRSLEKLRPLDQDVCIVSPASERSLFNGNPCFVILKEQGGQIYAKCAASTEL